MCSPFPRGPLQMNPPMDFATPPIPDITDEDMSNTDHEVPHASTSSARITAPIIVIPDHEPLTTTLTPQELSELMPLLHIFIESSHPNVALLPAASVSYEGVKQALRWRETDLQQSEHETPTDLIELVQIYQALSYLGCRPEGRALSKIGKIIHSEIDGQPILEEYQELWALRFLPFTEPFIKSLAKRIARLERAFVELVDEEDFEWKMTIPEYAENIDAAAEILRWVYDDESLKAKVKRMCLRLEWELKKKNAREP